jgi:hypothetical protein
MKRRLGKNSPSRQLELTKKTEGQETESSGWFTSMEGDRKGDPSWAYEVGFEQKKGRSLVQVVSIDSLVLTVVEHITI